MGAKPVILLDDGSVMNDTRLRGPQYQRLVGEFFAPGWGASRAPGLRPTASASQASSSQSPGADVCRLLRRIMPALSEPTGMIG